MSAKLAEHPFFCRDKGVAKSAWDTPEYLTADDWQLGRDALATVSPEALHSLLYSEPARAEAFFYRVIGWSEGRHYMRDLEFAQSTGWAGLQKHAFPKLRDALALHDKN